MEYAKRTPYKISTDHPMDLMLVIETSHGDRLDLIAHEFTDSIDNWKSIGSANGLINGSLFVKDNIEIKIKQ